MGGSDDPSNIELVTLKEHIQRHKDLYKKYGHWQDKIAYQAMSGLIKSEDVFIQVNKENGKKMGKLNVHHLHTPEVRKKQLERTIEVNKGKKLTTEHKEKIRQKRIGQKQPQIQKDKVRIKKSKWWYITYPDGKTEKIFNLNEFAKQHNLDQGNLVKVSQGVLKQHKKYVCKQA